MKNILILIIASFSISCGAQTTYSLSNPDAKYENNNHIKDIEGILDKFVGTWQWTDGTNKLTIIFTKILDWKISDRDFYEDKIIGNYKYEIVGGSIITNTLNFNSTDINSTNFPTMLTRINKTPFDKL